MPSSENSDTEIINALVSIVHGGSVASTNVSINKVRVDIQLLYDDTRVGVIEIIEKIERLGHFPLTFIESVKEAKAKIATMSLSERQELGRQAFGIWKGHPASWFDLRDLTEAVSVYDVVSESNYIAGYVVSS